MVAPVVVNPETVSKSAFMKLGTDFEITNGSAANILIIIQQNATITKPSFEYIVLFFGRLKVRSIPNAAQSNAQIMKYIASCS